MIDWARFWGGLFPPWQWGWSWLTVFALVADVLLLYIVVRVCLGVLAVPRAVRRRWGRP